VLAGRDHPTYGSPSGLTYLRFTPDASPLGEWAPPEARSLGASVRPVDGQRLLVMQPWNTRRRLLVLDAARPGAEPEVLFDGQGTLYSWQLAGQALLYVHGDVTNPGELYLAEAADVAGTTTALSDLNAALRSANRVRFEPITYTTSSGFQLEGVYIYPSDWSFPPAEPMPVVVWQLGGPGGHMLNTFGTSVESPLALLPNFGIPVFVVNGAGRYALDPAFYSALADGRNFGRRDLQDVKEGVERLVAMGIADPNAVGVTGCSYGGYFTLQSMAEHPGFYAAGNAQCSLNDLMWEYNFGWSHTIGYLMGATPAGSPAEYAADSPFYRSGEIAQPLLLFHGTNDFLPFEHITNIHDQVAASGVPARFLRALGEGHGFSNTASQRYAMQLQVDWFRRHLFGSETAASFRAGQALRPGVRPGPILPHDLSLEVAP
jgi:dipeptidyl aminopeptidase/acylaminoacyl peptidase